MPGARDHSPQRSSVLSSNERSFRKTRANFQKVGNQIGITSESCSAGVSHAIQRTQLEGSGLSPSELLIGRQVSTKLDALVPSPAHAAQGRQSSASKEHQNERTRMVNVTIYQYVVGAPCYALYCFPNGIRKNPRWVPAVVVKVFGTRSVNVVQGYLKSHTRGFPPFQARKDAASGCLPSYRESARGSRVAGISARLI